MVIELLPLLAKASGAAASVVATTTSAATKIAATTTTDLFIYIFLMYYDIPIYNYITIKGIKPIKISYMSIK
jgi:hypothetical protein